MAKIVYKAGAIHYLADALFRLYRNYTGLAEYAQDPTEEEEEDLKATNSLENSPHTLFAILFISDTMSCVEQLPTLEDQCECGCDCSVREGNN